MLYVLIFTLSQKLNKMLKIVKICVFCFRSKPWTLKVSQLAEAPHFLEFLIGEKKQCKVEIIDAHGTNSGQSVKVDGRTVIQSKVQWCWICPEGFPKVPNHIIISPSYHHITTKSQSYYISSYQHIIIFLIIKQLLDQLLGKITAGFLLTFELTRAMGFVSYCISNETFLYRKFESAMLCFNVFLFHNKCFDQKPAVDMSDQSSFFRCLWR